MDNFSQNIKRKRNQITSLSNVNEQSEEDRYVINYRVEGKKGLPSTKQIEDLKQCIKDTYKANVSRVLTKESPIEEATNLYWASDLTYWKDEVLPEEMRQINYLKTKRFVDINDKFKAKFNDEREFIHWFTENKYKSIRNIFLNYKNQLNKEIEQFSGLKSNSKIDQKFDSKFDNFKKSEEYEIWKNENDENDLYKVKNQYKRVYKSRIISNALNGIKSKNLLTDDEKIEILQRHKLKEKISSISKSINKHYNTIHSFINRFKSGKGNRAFFKYEINRRYLSNNQLKQIEDYIDSQFGPGDNPIQVKEYIKDNFGVNINLQYAYSLLKQFGNNYVRFVSKQFDSTTRNYTLCRHLYNLYIISLYIKNKVEIYSVDEFNVKVQQKSKYIYKKPSIKKFYKGNSNYEKSLNVIIACSLNYGPICWQISEKPYNRLLYHEFMLKFKNYVEDHELDKNKNKQTLMDDAAFHGAPWTIAALEDDEFNELGYTHLGGLLSSANVAEYQINRFRSKFRQLKNPTDFMAAQNVHKVFSKMDQWDGLMVHKMTSNSWIEILDDVYDLLKKNMKIE